MQRNRVLQLLLWLSLLWPSGQLSISSSSFPYSSFLSSDAARRKLSSSPIYKIQVLVEPSQGRGGEPFLIQPQVAVYDHLGLLAPDLVGYVYAEMETSPTGYESLWVGTCDLTGCGVEAVRSNAKAYFDNGVATFEVFPPPLSLHLPSVDSLCLSLCLSQNLQIQSLGRYTLKFVGVNELGIPFSFTLSNEFTVTTGEPYTLSYVPYFGHISGGKTFQIQPSLKITDRGGNTITNLNTGTVTVSLSRQPDNVQTELLPQNMLTVPFVSGVAQFESLYLNTAGSPFQLAFRTNLVSSVFTTSPLTSILARRSSTVPTQSTLRTSLSQLVQQHS
jgi:hypothetical protein